MANEIITTLHPDQDPDTNLYPNIKKENIPNGSIDQGKLSDDVNNLLSNIGDLHPSGVDTSTHILAKTSDQGIWVGSDTGKWYYWSGSNYVVGGDYIVNIDTLATKDYVNDDNDWVIDPVWEAYSISSSTGQNANTSNRIRTQNYLLYKDYLWVYNSDQQRIKLFAYDNGYGYLGSVDWVWDNYDLSKLKDVYSNVYYIRMIVQISENAYSTFNNIKLCPLSYLVNLKNTIKTNKYLGVKIDLDNAYNYENYMTITGAQGGTAIAVDQGKFLFDFDSNNNVYIYNLDNKNLMYTRLLPNAEPPHANCVCFGNEKVNSGEIFPLIYVNRYNATPYENGVCYVYNISGDLSNFVLKQTIKIGFINDPLWSDVGDTRPFGNFIVDTDNNFLYVYTLLDSTKVTRVFKFNLPKLNDGTLVTLNTTDILDYFDLPYYQYIQDCCYYKGKLYITSGFGYDPSYAYVHVINLSTKQEISTINLCDTFGVGSNYEPEIIYILNGKLFLSFKNGNLIKFDF